MMIRTFLGFLLLLALALFSCEKSEPSGPSLTAIGITVNGASLSDGAMNVPIAATFQLTFSGTLDPAKFEAAFSLRPSTGSAPALAFSYTNASSKVTISATLRESTAYTLEVQAGEIGSNGGRLENTLRRQFTSAGAGIITEQEPCTSASPNCLTTLSVQAGNGDVGDFSCYSSFPLEIDNARWERLRYALIVVHGQNRNANDYFTWMMTTLRNEGLEEETILISPFFKSATDAQADDIYWPAGNWREGQNSAGPAGVSAFAVVDQIIARLADTAHFPVLEKIVLAGHSSGALFAHAYAAANRAQAQHAALEFRYVVANSQYFYYPEDVRYDSGAGQFTAPAGCSDFNHWPLGYVATPPYLDAVSEATVDQQLINRRVTYLLGTNDTLTTGTLNTTDCGPVLLGAHRFDRGENMFRFVETFFADTHQHGKVIVPGVGHDGREMFQSGPFVNWLRDEF